MNAHTYHKVTESPEYEENESGGGQEYDAGEYDYEDYGTQDPGAEEYYADEGYADEGYAEDAYAEEGYQEVPAPVPPRQPPGKKLTKKERAKQEKARKLKEKKAKAKAAKQAKAQKSKGKKAQPGKGKGKGPGRRPAPPGTAPARRLPPPGRGPRPSSPAPLPPPPGYQQEVYEEEGQGSTQYDPYGASYPQEEYFPVDDQGIVIEDQSMIETVTVEDDASSRKAYQRKTDDPIYSIEEKIDRMLMGKELSLAERFQRKFGEELELDTGAPISGYTPRDRRSEDEDEDETPVRGKLVKATDRESGKKVPGGGKKDRDGDRKAKGPVKKEKGPVKKEKEVQKGKEKAGKEKKSGLFGSFPKFGGDKPKETKGPSVADLMSKTQKKPAPAPGPSTPEVSPLPKPSRAAKSAAVEKPPALPKPSPAVEPAPEPESATGEDTDIGYTEFSTFKTMVDTLLENLPGEVIESFTASDEFAIYERVGTADDFTDQDHEYIKIVDNLLEKLPEHTVSEFMESDDFELYQRIVEWGSA